MKKIFLFILLVASLFADVSENISSENINIGLYNLKLKQYELNKFSHKDKIYALAMTTILPGAGHIYAQEPVRGFSFVGSEFICAMVYLIGLDMWKKADTDDKLTNASNTMFVGNLGFIIFKVFEWYDVMFLIDNKNAELRKKLEIDY